jgi:hypothetical protein
MSIEAGVYKNESGSYGYVNPSGVFNSGSRDAVRMMSIQAGYKTTLKGTYIPPKEEPVVNETRAYNRHNIGNMIANSERGSILCEVSDREFYRVYMAYLMYAKKHNEIKGHYLYGRTGEGSIVFVRW